jgi:hypothetical protein
LSLNVPILTRKVFTLFSAALIRGRRSLKKRDLKHACTTATRRRQQKQTSSNKLLRRRIVVYYPLHVYMNWVQFEEIKTKALWLKTLLLSKFVVSLVASRSWHVCVVHETWKSLVFCCKKPYHNASNSRWAFNYSFLLY